jgi:hypothetical protein
MDNPDCTDCGPGQQMDLFQCSPEYAHDLIICSAVIVVFYGILTATRFLPAAYHSSSRVGRWTWLFLSFIFFFCGITGYATVVLSGWFPEAAYSSKLWFMKFNAASCVVFWFMTRGRRLELGEIKRHQAEEALDDETLSPLARIGKAREILNREGES